MFLWRNLTRRRLRNTDPWRILIQALLSTTSQLTVRRYNVHLQLQSRCYDHWLIYWLIYIQWCTLLYYYSSCNGTKCKQSIQPKNYKHSSNPCHLLLPLPSSISASRLRFNSAILMISFLLSIPYLSNRYICHCISLGLRKGGKLGVFKGWNECFFLYVEMMTSGVWKFSSRKIWPVNCIPGTLRIVGEEKSSWILEFAALNWVPYS